MEELLEKLYNLAKRKHYYCEDSWYSCPKQEDGCADEKQGDECNCGAEEHNRDTLAIYEQIKAKLKPNKKIQTIIMCKCADNCSYPTNCRSYGMPNCPKKGIK